MQLTRPFEQSVDYMPYPSLFTLQLRSYINRSESRSQCGNRAGAIPTALFSPDQGRFGALCSQGLGYPVW